MQINFDLRKEKTDLKKKWPNAFLLELDRIIEQCFLKPKLKKEHFITQDKIIVEFLKLLQSQKKFQPSTNNKINFSTLGTFDLETNKVGRIESISPQNKKIEYKDIFGSLHMRNFSDVVVFDIYSPEMEFYFEKQKRFYDAFNFKDTFHFLTHVPETAQLKEMVRLSTISGEQKIKLDIPMDYSK